MTNPFDDEQATFTVVVNAAGQHSLWVDFLPVPRGWTAVGSRGTRAACLEWIERHWPDMRPKDPPGYCRGADGAVRDERPGE